MVLSGIALVTRMPPTRTKYNVQETAILMQYVQAITLPRSMDRREEAESLLSQAAQHQILPHYHSQGPERLH